MTTKQIKDIRRRLSDECETLIGSLNRNRQAVEEITLENTEDEADLANISHDRDLLYNVHKGGFERLRSVREAIKALENGQYGECISCGNDINKKRLEAVPWATTCIRCQEEAEAEQVSSRMSLSGLDAEAPEF